MTRTFVFILVLLVASVAEAQPTISYATPGAVATGATTELTLHGDKLTGPLQVWTSFPSKVEVTLDPKNPKAAKCKVTVDKGVPVHVGGLVVANAAGVSTQIFISVDDVPSIADNGKNNDKATAQMLTLPAGVDGVSNGNKFDFYKFTGKKGERVSAEVIAARSGSAFDAVMRLYDPTGKQLAIVDDEDGLGADCRFSTVLPVDGEYIVQVSDNKYAAGGRYRLRIGSFPLISSVYPLGGRFGSTRQFAASGPEVAEAAEVLFQIPSGNFRQRMPIGVKNTSGKGSSMACFWASDLPESLEQESNNDIQSANDTIVPCAINGAFQEAGDEDFFRFAGKKGQRLEFRGISSSVGSPSYVMFSIMSADGKVQAATKVSTTSELALTHTLPADGVYYLKVNELLRRGGSEFTYRVEVAPSRGFSLAIKNDKNTNNRFKVAKNGAIIIPVTCARTGYDGPIELSVEKTGYPTGSISCTLYQTTLAAKAKETQLIVSVPDSVPDGSFGTLRIVGRIPGQSTPVDYMHTSAWWRGKLPQMLHPPDWLDGMVYITVGGKAGDYYAVNMARPDVYMASSAGSAKATFTTTAKNKEFKTPLKVFFDGLPPGTTASVAQDKKNKALYTISVAGKGLTPGTHEFRMVTLGMVKNVWQKQTHSVKLHVVEAPKVTIEPAGPLMVGGKQLVKVRIEQPGGSKPVSLDFAALPKGVTKGSMLTLIPEANQLVAEFELSAAADAAVGKQDAKLNVVTKYGADSLATVVTGKIEVKKAPAPKKAAPAKKPPAKKK